MALDPLPGEISGKVIGARRAELAAAMGPPPVVVGLVPGQDGPGTLSCHARMRSCGAGLLVRTT